MLGIFLRGVRAPENPQLLSFAPTHFVWAIGSLCALFHKSFDGNLLLGEFPVGQGELASEATLVHGAQSLGFRLRAAKITRKALPKLPMPLLIAQAEISENGEVIGQGLALITAANPQKAVMFLPGRPEPKEVSLDSLVNGQTLKAWIVATDAESANDADSAAGISQTFGFRWFVPELLRHRKVWRDVLLASLALQVVALSTPLFTQAIIDKVITNRTQSTLIAIGLAMALFIVFNGLMSWTRQYLVLHTGNRVDSVLGAAVWEHLLKLPLRYFEHRATGVVAARMHAVENIREFVSGAAISLVLDLPFLLICLGVMIWYSPLLSAVVVGILAIIAIASFLMAPVFQRQLNDQFLLGARNQAFVTEHIAGFETVKTLQMEPSLRQRYSGYLATLLASSFRTKQIANTYNTLATSLEQVMTLGILILGAYLVMTPSPGSDVFTVGMLVAFQMFAGKLSQPVLRIVGLWTQFQQANLSVKRLGDVMNAPIEPYSVSPQRQNDGAGSIEIEGLGFRFDEKRPYLYNDLSLKIHPGQTIAIMGPSGSGKSTLAKLLLGLYHPSAGSIKIDGIDTRNLSANELRSYFGVVPQETILFSGSILSNLQAGSIGASFDQVTRAAKMAGIHDVIEKLPAGYKTEIGERGVGLSGGQKQRLAIARALLKRPKILIFDEATSSLDNETAESFAKTVNQMKGKVTMLFITHAMPKSLQADGILRIHAKGVTMMQQQPNDSLKAE